MKTDDLVSMLAAGDVAVDVRASTRRLVVAVGTGTLVATILMALWLDLRPTLARDAAVPMFWIKEAFCVALVVAGLFAVARLSRPGAAIAWVRPAAAVPVIALWLLAAAVLTAASPEDRADLVLGISWRECTFNIAALSIPVFAAIVWAMTDLAPTRLRLAGSAAGFAAGGIGALVYTLHCPELDAPFLGLWYVLGVMVPTTFGALAGPRLLRW